MLKSYLFSSEKFAPGQNSQKITNASLSCIPSPPLGCKFSWINFFLYPNRRQAPSGKQQTFNTSRLKSGRLLVVKRRITSSIPNEFSGRRKLQTRAVRCSPAKSCVKK